MSVCEMPETKAEARAMDEGYTAYRKYQTTGHVLTMPEQYQNCAYLAYAYCAGYEEARDTDRAENY